jgi:hypothetical protein
MVELSLSSIRQNDFGSPALCLPHGSMHPITDRQKVFSRNDYPQRYLR